MIKDVNVSRPGLYMEPVLLPGCGIEKPAYDAAGKNERPKPHIDQRHGQCSQYQPCKQEPNPPIDELSFETFKNKGLLKPLINSVLSRHLQAEERLNNQCGDHQKDG